MALRPGITLTKTTTVSELLTVPAMADRFAGFEAMPPVFATAFLVAFAEWASLDCVQPHLPPGQRTVGTHIDISHLAATPIGMRITARVELLSVEGRKLRFAVECTDEAGLIGKGFHERAIIDEAKFMERLRAKAGG
jgi:fluoroacetyl-CoA thioesterase